MSSTENERSGPRDPAEAAAASEEQAAGAERDLAAEAPAEPPAETDAEKQAATPQPSAAEAETPPDAAAPDDESPMAQAAAADDDSAPRSDAADAEAASRAAAPATNETASQAAVEAEADTAAKPPDEPGTAGEGPAKQPSEAAEAAAAAGTQSTEESAAPAEAVAGQPSKPPETPALRAIREALEQRQPVEGRVIGWNNGGFHLAIGELAAFCPRSEMEAGEVADPASYVDQTLLFRVLRLQGKGRRIVVSRAAQLRAESNRQRSELRKKLQPGAVVEGTVASLADFGAFVELGGGRGLVHVSEISHSRVDHPSSVLSEGQQVKVKVLKIEKGGRRISLSMRALEPDPWKEIKGLEQGAVVKGKVEKANELGAFIEVAPGLTGLLPARSMSIPRETTPARAYPPGKEVSVQIMSIDRRRQRISLALEGSSLEGSRTDYKDYQRERRIEGEGFNALASAFRRLESDDD